MANSKADKYDMFKEFEEAIRRSKALSEKQLNEDSKSPAHEKPVPVQLGKTATKANGNQPRADSSKSSQIKSSASAQLGKTEPVKKADTDSSSGKLKWLMGMLVAVPIYMIHSWYTSSQEAEQEWTQQRETVTDAFNSVNKLVWDGKGVEELKSALPKIHEVSASVKMDKDRQESYEKHQLGCFRASQTLEECFIGELFDAAPKSSNGEAMKTLYEADPETVASRIKDYSASGIDTIFFTVMTKAESSPAKWNLGSLLMKNGANPDPAGADRDMVKYIRSQNPPDDFMKQVEEQAEKHALDFHSGGDGVSKKGLKYIETKLGITKVEFPHYYNVCMDSREKVISWRFTGKKGNEPGAGCMLNTNKEDKGLWFETYAEAKSAMKKYMKEEEGLTGIEFHGKVKNVKNSPEDEDDTADEACGGAFSDYSFAMNFTAMHNGKPVKGIVCRKFGRSNGYTDMSDEFKRLKYEESEASDEADEQANNASEESTDADEQANNTTEESDEPSYDASEESADAAEEPDDAPAARESRRSGGDYDLYIRKASAKYGVDANLIRAVMVTESAAKRMAVSPKGAQGLMQLMPETARRYGVRDSFDPEQNINGGTKYLRFLFNHYSGETKLILAAYNAGEKAVDEYGGIPPYKETIQYVKRVQRELGRLLKLNSQNR